MIIKSIPAWLSIFTIALYIISNISFAVEDYELNEFNDLNLNTIEEIPNKPQQNNKTSKKVVLFDDNLYLFKVKIISFLL